MKVLAVLGFLLGIHTCVWADITPKDSFNALPTGSTIKVLKDLSIAPYKGEVTLGYFSQDADGDGVPDYEDWCPETPKGSKVWTPEKATAKECRQIDVGCMGNGKEKWLHSARTPDVYPSGETGICKLKVMQSGEDRLIAKGTTLTVIDRYDPFLTADERTWLLRTDIGEKYVQNVPLRSPGGGTHFGLSCYGTDQARKPYGNTRYEPGQNGKPGRYVLTEIKGYKLMDLGSHLLKISILQTFAQVTIAKPVPIP